MKLIRNIENIMKDKREDVNNIVQLKLTFIMFPLGIVTLNKEKVIVCDIASSSTFKNPKVH